MSEPFKKIPIEDTRIEIPWSVWIVWRYIGDVLIATDQCATEQDAVELCCDWEAGAPDNIAKKQKVDRKWGAKR